MSRPPHGARSIRWRLLPLLLWTTACGQPERDVAPNILLVVCDALRADHLELYGYDRTTAPQLAAWAQDAVVFDAATAASNWTRPSMHALFTGRNAAPGRIFGQGERVPGDEPVLPELLQAAGYATAAVSANPLMSPSHGVDRGFDDFIALGWRGREHVGHWKPEIASEVVIDKVEALLSTRPADGRPLFLYVHLMDTHVPYDPPAVYRDEGAPEYAGPFDGSAEAFVALRGLHVDERLAPEDKARVIALYDGEIRHLDASLARLRKLADEFLGDRPLLTVLTADHGEAFGEGEDGAYLHGVGMTDALLHVPLVVEGAGSAGRVAERVGLVDLLPTLLARAGVAAPADIDGIDLLASGGASLAVPGRTYLSYRALPPPSDDAGAPIEAFGELAFSRDALRVLRREGQVPPDFAADFTRWLDTSRKRAVGSAAPQPALLPDDAQERLQALGYTGK